MLRRKALTGSVAACAAVAAVLAATASPAVRSSAADRRCSGVWIANMDKADPFRSSEKGGE